MESRDNAPVTDIKRGPVDVKLFYQDPEYVYAEVRTGQNVSRTAFTSIFDHAQLVADVLVILGFKPFVTSQELKIDWGEGVDEDDEDDE